MEYINANSEMETSIVKKIDYFDLGTVKE